MSSDVSSLLDKGTLSRVLPMLIGETHLEQQATNIEEWLNHLLPVHSVGFMIKGNTNGDFNVYANDHEGDAPKKIEMCIRENDFVGEGTVDDMMLFEYCDGSFKRYGSGEGHRKSAANGIAFSLNHNGKSYGKFFLIADKDISNLVAADENHLSWFRSIMSSVLYNTWRHHQDHEKERFLSIYETVSSSLCYAGDLQELLTTIISIIVSELPSEEGSILLYNDNTNELEFYSAIGETGAGYVQCSFPADRGIAGKALQEGAPIVVNDVNACPFFFGEFDNKTGFVTKSILAAPIIFGGEKVGVIEAINKAGEDSFHESDKGIMLAIADEVGLAVKNARMFDYVVKSYCKLKQGKSSCKGCERPLRSWTPCARQLDLL